MFIVVWQYEDFTNAGNLSLAMNITNFFYLIAIYSMRFFQISDFNNQYNDCEFIISRVFTCITSIILCIIFILIADLSNLQRLIIFIYMLFRASEAFIDVFHGISQKHWRMDYIGISLILRSIFMLTVFVIIGNLFGFLFAIIGIFIITVLIGLLYDLPKTIPLIKFTRIKIKNILLLIKNCFPLMLVPLISNFIAFYSRYSIEKIYGTEDLGIYTSVIAPTMVLQVSISFLFVPLSNVISSYVNDKKYKVLFNLFILCIISIIGFTMLFYILFYFFGEWGLTFIFGISIKDYSYLLLGAVIIGGLTGLMWYMNIFFTIIRDIKGILYGNIIGVFICVLITNYLLNKYYLNGANYILIISMGISLLYLLFRFFWYYKKKYKINDIIGDN